MTAALPDLGWIDWTLLGVLLLSVAVGLMRGVVFELLSLAGWLVAWFAAQWFAADVARHLPFGTPGGSVNLASAFALTFVAAIVVWSLLARFLRLLLHSTPLSLPDRALGAGFGLVRGCLLLLVVATVVALTPAAQSHAWRESRGALWLNTSLQGLKPVLPAPLLRWLP